MILNHLLFQLSSAVPDEPPCESTIYCHGDLLDTIQRLEMFEESKYFVDMGIKLTTTEKEILEDFGALTAENKSDAVFMKTWVQDRFDEPGFEFQNFDFTINENPASLAAIKDSSYKEWAMDLNKIWSELGRDTQNIDSDRTSFVTVSNPVVVPTGHDGRFRESYYWDSYWIIIGMLHSEMYDPVKGILDNFSELIESYGFVPNGTRVYYNRRSQPPFFSMMVSAYIDSLPDSAKAAEISRYLPYMETEYSWWETNRTIQIGDYSLFHYNSPVNMPRPEAYMNDFNVLQKLASAEDKQILSSHITSAAESGWDFSSRWTGSKYVGEPEDLLSEMITTDIVPVDLNFLLAWTAKKIADFQTISGSEATVYEAKSKLHLDSIESVLFDNSTKCYFDYNRQSNGLNQEFYASNYVPLFTDVWASSVNKSERQGELLNCMREQGVLDFAAGIPNSMQETGQQWDFPNCWPPSQHMIIMGLNKSENQDCKDEAKSQADKWIRNNYDLYKNNENHMFEKINAESGDYGNGGEYQVQTGFGWTNGSVIDILTTFDLSYEVGTEEPNTSTSSAMKLATVSLVAIVSSLLV